MKKPHLRATHPASITWLKRDGGRLRPVIEMIVVGKSCLDIVPLRDTGEKAVVRAKSALIHDHIDHYLGRALAITFCTKLNSIARSL